MADGLFAKGHAITVLTSTDCNGEEIDWPYPVLRVLPLNPDWDSHRPVSWQFFVGRVQKEHQASAYLRQLVMEFHPDVVFVWNTTGLPKTLLQQVEQLPGLTIAYYLADYLPERPDEYIRYWQAQPAYQVAKTLKRVLAKVALRILADEGKPISLRYENVACVSDYVRRRLVSQGLISENAVVVHNGVNLTQFSPNGYSNSESLTEGLHCLIAGRIEASKGIHTVIDALAVLKAQIEMLSVTLTVIGSGPADYLNYLQKKIHDNDLQGTVKFHSPVPRDQMPEVLSCYNVFILPSEWDEPLSCAMQEAMAKGLLVIGTNTGGSGELLVHEETGLVFKAGDPESLATQFLRVLNEPKVVARFAKIGQQTVINHFTIQNMVEQSEHYLLDLVKGQEVQSR